MKDSQIRMHLDYMCFVQETEDYQMTTEAEQYAIDVLDDELSGDEAISRILEEHNVSRSKQIDDTEDNLYPDTDVFINYFGILDQKKLDELETLIVSVRMAELFKNEFDGVFDFEYLKIVHYQLFSDIYPFAGKIRYIPITRRTMFCLPQYIDTMAEEIFTKLREEKFLRNQEFEEFIDNLAYFMAEVHALHPFLDGNTRAMRIFFQQLSHKALWHINPSDTDDSRLLEADIAALEGDYQPLISLLHSAVEPYKA
ncbi:MAG: cell filamentation protein Fic [Spirochaetia bacterium]|nr:cell filamentation protein Fic [Spirochaetia bacterium]